MRIFMHRIISIAGLLFLSAAMLAQQPSLAFRGSLTASCSNANTTCTATTGSTVENTTGFNTIGFSGDLSPFGLATVTVSGTYSGVTINFEFSDDGGTTWFAEQCTRTDVNVQEPSEALPSNQVRAWDCGLSGPTKFRVRASAFGSGTVNVGVTITISPIEPAPTAALSDPCYSNAVTTTVVSLSGTTATQVIALSGNAKIWVCGFTVGNGGGTTPTFSLEYGTGTNCAAGTQVILAAVAIPASTAAPLQLNSNPFAVTPGGQALCWVLTGTTPTGTLTLNTAQQ